MKRSRLSILVLNQPGTLVKVATVISGRGLNIHELCAKVTDDPGLTRIDVDFLGDEEKLLQTRRHLAKLEVVRDVSIVSGNQQI